MKFAIICLCCLISFGAVFCAISTTECGISKTCQRNIPDCDLTNSNCLFFSYVWNTTTSTFFMEMSGGSGNSIYYGVAFSPKAQMMDADVYFCVRNNLLSGTIRERGVRPGLTTNLPPEITNAEFEITSGVSECTFQRTANVAKVISNSVRRNFNLRTENFFILQAFGRYSAAGNMVQNHGQNRWFSSHPFNFTTVSDGPIPTTTAASTTTARTPQSRSCSRTGSSTPNCFSIPADCTVFRDSPCLFASWNIDNDTRMIDIEIIGGEASRSNQYIAIAFGTVNRMEDADLYYCTQNGVFSGAIRERQRRPAVFSETNGIRRPTSGLENGVIRCSFRREGSVTKQVSNGRSVDFNVFSGRYYLLLATGSLSGNGQLSRHASLPNARAVSEFVIGFGSGTTARSANYCAIVVAQIFLFWIKMI